jgi:hypothetical protein
VRTFKSSALPRLPKVKFIYYVYCSMAYVFEGKSRDSHPLVELSPNSRRPHQHVGEVESGKDTSDKENIKPVNHST